MSVSSSFSTSSGQCGFPNCALRGGTGPPGRTLGCRWGVWPPVISGAWVLLLEVCLRAKCMPRGQTVALGKRPHQRESASAEQFSELCSPVPPLSAQTLLASTAPAWDSLQDGGSLGPALPPAFGSAHTCPRVPSAALTLRLPPAAPAVPRGPRGAEVQLLRGDLGRAPRAPRAARPAEEVSGARLVRQPHRAVAPLLPPAPGREPRVSCHRTAGLTSGVEEVPAGFRSSAVNRDLGKAVCPEEAEKPLSCLGKVFQHHSPRSFF